MIIIILTLHIVIKKNSNILDNFIYDININNKLIKEKNMYFRPNFEI